MQALYLPHAFTIFISESTTTRSQSTVCLSESLWPSRECLSSSQGKWVTASLFFFFGLLCLSSSLLDSRLEPGHNLMQRNFLEKWVRRTFRKLGKGAVDFLRGVMLQRCGVVGVKAKLGQESAPTFRHYANEIHIFMSSLPVLSSRSVNPPQCPT